ncbi:hypothetical protein NLG97_g9197 [Lecanicillium saksenae]|uniref:Uncharacterized protein n=1 Tax=Lecanicillium saksenae TaxID=468837 RepID=A0ACC1QJE8_9HYPO|nr:hypothetical protein NLG97_g9197 [Lecanicillium saksenae]
MKFFAKPPANIRCPDLLWGDGSGKDMLGGTSNTRPLVANSQWIARISDKFVIDQAPIPGNASFTHGRTTMRFRSFDEQKKLAIIAFSVGYPSGGPGERDDNTLNMACLRIGKAEKGSSGSGKDSKDNGAGQLGLGLATVGTAIMMSLFTI